MSQKLRQSRPSLSDGRETPDDNIRHDWEAIARAEAEVAGELLAAGHPPGKTLWDEVTRRVRLEEFVVGQAAA